MAASIELHDVVSKRQLYLSCYVDLPGRLLPNVRAGEGCLVGGADLLKEGKGQCPVHPDLGNMLSIALLSGRAAT